MSHEQPTQLWRGIGASVLGENHRRTGKPNQDAIGWYPQSGVGAPVVLTIADGHGGAAYPRSAEGAALAVQVCNNVLYALLSDAPRLRAVRNDDDARLKLADLIVTSWRDSVDALAGPDSAADESRFIPFGTTLLSAAIGTDCILYLQLGDGDLVILDSAGEISRPFPPDPRLTGNATTSLCLSDAALHMRILAAPRHPAPAMIAMATDGYANSFQDDLGFLAAWRDIAVHLGQQGPDRLAHSLQGWLAETTKLGSGDDITVGLLACLDGRIAAIPPVKPAPPAVEPVTPKPEAAEPAHPAEAAPPSIAAAPPMPPAPKPLRRNFWPIGLAVLAIAAAAAFAVHALAPPAPPKMVPPAPQQSVPAAPAPAPATGAGAGAPPVKQPVQNPASNPPPAAPATNSGTGGHAVPPAKPATSPGARPAAPTGAKAAPTDKPSPPASGTEKHQSPLSAEGTVNE